MEPPNITLTAEDGSPEPRKTIRFQCGLLRETETFVGDDMEVLCQDALHDWICDMLTTKFPEHPYGDMLDKLILYRHTSDDVLVPLREEDIEDGTIIEIILRAKAKQEYDEVICPHILTVQTYRTPGAFCDYCGSLLFGLLKQGLKCEGCDKNFHKKCAFRVPNNCTRLKLTDGVSNPPLNPRPSQLWSGRPLWIDRTLKNRQHVPHTFFVHTTKKPTQCFYCKKLLKGMFRQGLRCKDCNIIVHKRCSKEIGNNCPGEVPSLSRVDSGEWTMANIARHVIANEFSEDLTHLDANRTSTISEEAREDSPLSTSSGQEQAPMSTTPITAPASGHITPTLQEHIGGPLDSYPGAPMSVIAEEPSDTGSNDGSEHNPADVLDSVENNIKLQRVTGVSMRHTKALPASVLKEGWMVHYTNKSSVRKKHYWRLDTKCLTFYKTETSTSYFTDIALVDILAVDPVLKPELYPLKTPHVFDIVTNSMTYYVGVDMSASLPQDLTPDKELDCSGGNVLGDVSHMTIPQLEEWGVGLNIGIAWEDALHGALMPITPQASMGSLADVGVGVSGMRPPSFRKGRGSLRGSLHGSRGGSSFRGSTRGRKGSMRGSFRVPKQVQGASGAMGSGAVPTRPPTSTTVVNKPKVETKMDISLFYQIFPEEILGSGQFGTVYGGQSRQNNKVVAVKVIDKLRFPHKHESQLRTEVTILQTLSHPGIICLEQMFENNEKIYVVMEKMNGDMLEMILNSPNSRLSERLTKYMIYQILMALQYLHKKDIVHCDLKPENVLLTSETGLPQAKLCDFGFARIIGEKCFRKSIVGTPAYLAPEVLKSEGYNRSLDLWSVGVIIYVSLSGTFPFNEDEEIADQIHNAAFMYPADPWGSVSAEAVDLINRLLQVSRKSRFKTSQALNHKWLGDKELWEDLCQLEGNLGMRYLTHENEDNFWTSHGAKPHPLAKAEAEKKTQLKLEQQQLQQQQQRASNATPTSTTSSGKGVQEDQISNGSVASNASSKHGSEAGVFADSAATGTSKGKEEEAEQGKTTPSEKSRKDYLSMTDEEVLKAQEHARRVGFKVSTV